MLSVFSILPSTAVVLLLLVLNNLDIHREIFPSSSNQHELCSHVSKCLNLFRLTSPTNRAAQQAERALYQSDLGGDVHEDIHTYPKPRSIYLFYK